MQKLVVYLHFFQLTRSKNIVVLIILLALQGCAATYTTPAGGVNITALTDEDIAELFKVEPASSFPARVAVMRVQASGYFTKTNHSYGSGRFSVITNRDIEEDEDLSRLAKLPMITAIAPMSRLLLPAELTSLRDLRRSAARLKTDLLLIYSVDTAFHVEGTPLGPLSLVSLGFIPNKKAFVTSTTSGALIDVRTGFVYGVAEATEREEQRHSIWNSENAIEEARLKAEKTSYKAFTDEFEKLWKSTVESFGASPR